MRNYYNKKGSNAGFFVVYSPERDEQTTKKLALEPFLLPLSGGAILTIFRPTTQRQQKGL